MSAARIFIRLDDACPTWDRDRWSAVLDLLVQYGVRPLVAVVPDNRDPDLVRGAEDPGFWDRVREWERLGWPLGLHGWRHRLRHRTRGLVPRNAFGEFAGESLARQREMIRRAWARCERQGWRPSWWVAPAHNFDRNTLEALRLETPIRFVSDGWALRPLRRAGFVWLPQQLGRPLSPPFGFWTICLHPNMMDTADRARLARWLRTRPPLGRWESVTRAATAQGLEDALMHGLLSFRHRLRSLRGGDR